ncbi:RHOMBOID-like protein [Heracleum sosnowskyi]|uniref:RHOMBOID-like protein n=1 Tax=Heracleum sosnowskyi TaxID=360622 RepID=A0AAD8JHN8_9APIA|nr:RHOMBOID-like protein [Heracleum sosnowskyi]
MEEIPIAIPDDSPIKIKASTPLHRSRLSMDGDDLSAPVQATKVPFFRSLKQRKENAWIISLFVFLHVVVFATTMFINNCWHNSHRDCALSALGRFSFQRLDENPLLGPSASTLEEMGALQRTLLMREHENWRLFTSPWLHSGVFHLIINLASMLFVGIHLEQEFGPVRIGVIYILSAITGNMVASLFLQDRPAVTSSGTLFGLLGTMLSGLIQNWKIYSRKTEALRIFSFILVINMVLGLLPYVNNFSNFGGFMCGFFLGFVLLFKPDLGKLSQSKAGLFEYEIRHSFRLRQKLDRPVLRIVFLVLFSLLLAGLLIGYLHGINVNKSCTLCRSAIDLVFLGGESELEDDDDELGEELDSGVGGVDPSSSIGSNASSSRKTMVSEGRLTLTCDGNGKFKVFPFSLSQERMNDICNLMCSG